MGIHTAEQALRVATDVVDGAVNLGGVYFVHDDMMKWTFANIDAWGSPEHDVSMLPSATGVLIIQGGGIRSVLNGIPCNSLVYGFLWFSVAGFTEICQIVVRSPSTDYDLVHVARVDWSNGKLKKSNPDAGVSAEFPFLAGVLMQERTVAVAEGEVTRGAARRAKRAGYDGSVTVIELRRPSSRAREKGASGRKLKSRFLYSGYWADHYFASDGTHRRTWRSGSVRGPSDQPIVIKPRVHAWVR